MEQHEGSVVRDIQGEVIPKDKWKDNGVLGGMFRLAVCPTSIYEAAVYLQVAPGSKESFENWLDTKKVPEQFSGVPAIRMTSKEKITMGPREATGLKCGLAIIPFIIVTSEDDARVVLPSTEALRREAAGTLRSVSIPKKCEEVKGYEKLLENGNPPKADIPPILWPEVGNRAARTNLAGE